MNMPTNGDRLKARKLAGQELLTINGTGTEWNRRHPPSVGSFIPFVPQVSTARRVRA
jgi:hypothetical protein